MLISTLLFHMWYVAPHGGAWIEIAEEDFEFEEDEGRSPRGSVD